MIVTSNHYLTQKVSSEQTFPASTSCSHSLPFLDCQHILNAHRFVWFFCAATLLSLCDSSSSFSLPEMSSPICLLRVSLSFKSVHKRHLSVIVTVSLSIQYEALHLCLHNAEFKPSTGNTF